MSGGGNHKWQNRTKDCEHYKNVVLNKVLPPFPAKVIPAHEFDFYGHILQDCFAYPTIVQGYSEKFGIQVPPSDFTIHQVAELLGNDTAIRLMDVAEQREISGFTIAQYADYLQKNQEVSASIEAGTVPPGNALKILNLISLEFSDTKLSNVVKSPNFVPQLDWEDLILTDSQLNNREEERNRKLLAHSVGSDDDNDCSEEKGKKISSKVQKYCLIGMAGSYTDFHIDFGGTSVWYHIVRGGKRFYVIPPTQQNLDIYEKWNRSTDQQSMFLGDLVEKGQCFYLDLHPQQTLLLPSAWIHAVYTPEDSLVFGGNFIHMPGIKRQLACHEIENHLKIKKIYRYPSFIPLQWKILCLVLRSLVGGKEENVRGTDDWNPQRLKTWNYLLSQSSILKQISAMADTLLTMFSTQSSDITFKEEVEDICQGMVGMTPSKVFENVKIAIYRLLSSPEMDTEESKIVPEIVNYDKCLSSTLVLRLKQKQSKNDASPAPSNNSLAEKSPIPIHKVGSAIVKSDTKKAIRDVECSEFDEDSANIGSSSGRKTKRIRKEILDALVDEEDGQSGDDFIAAGDDEEDHDEEVLFAKIRYNPQEEEDDGFIIEDDDDDIKRKKKGKAKTVGSAKKISGDIHINKAVVSTSKPAASSATPKVKSKPPPSKRDQMKAILAKKWK